MLLVKPLWAKFNDAYHSKFWDEKLNREAGNKKGYSKFENLDEEDDGSLTPENKNAFEWERNVEE